jgi:hypothetical protein
MCRYHRCQGPEAFHRFNPAGTLVSAVADAFLVAVVFLVVIAYLVVIPEGDLLFAVALSFAFVLA